MTNYRWTICAMLFFATTVNYLDRQVLSLTWDEFIKPEFHWDESHYGTITSVFSIVYAICMLFAGRFIDWMGTKKGYLWAIGVWSFGACLHAGCGIATEHYVGMNSAAELIAATGDVVVPVVFWHWVKQVTSPLLSRLRLNTFQRKTVLMRLRSSMPVLLLGLWSLLSLFPCWQKLGVGKWLLS